MNLPIPYSIENLAAASISPSTYTAADNATFGFFSRYLWQKMTSIFKFTIPAEWDSEFFKYVLFGAGFVVILKTDDFGIIPQYGTVGGYRVMYNPDFVLLANELLPDLSGRELKIGKDCEVVKLTPDYKGVADLVGFYAAKMALCSQGIDINLYNSKLAYVFAAGSKAKAETFKKLYDDIASGNPAVVIDKALFNEDGSPNWQPFFQNLKNTYLVSDILSDLRKIEEEFDTKIGIPNANTDKRERLNTDEVNANNVETAIIAEGWKESITEGFRAVKKLYPEINCNVEWRVKPDVFSTSKPGDPVNRGFI